MSREDAAVPQAHRRRRLERRHMLAVLDACFSGAFRWSGARDLIRADEIVHREKHDRYVRSAAWQVITSAAQDRNALDQLSGVLGPRDGAGAHAPFAGVQVRSLYPPEILRALRQTSLCLSVAGRRGYLAEPADEASTRFAECERAQGRQGANGGNPAPP